MKHNPIEPIMSDKLANPIVNDQLDVIKNKFDFVIHVFGYDLVHTNFHFRVTNQNWVELVASHRNHGETVLGWGRSELEATDRAFDDAWTVATHDPNIRYGNWEDEHDIREWLDYDNHDPEYYAGYLQLYRDKLKALVDA